MCWCLQRDVLISAVADDQLKEHGVIAVTFASPKETPVSAGALAQFQWLQSAVTAGTIQTVRRRQS